MSITLAQFLRDFNTERKCLEFVASRRWPDGIRCETCEAVTKHYLIEKRKSYSCGVCGRHAYVTAGTIFHKSRTPLVTWLYVIFQMSHTRTGIAAKQVERETGVTYKTAWRMCQLVRAALASGAFETMTGTVEVDEVYMGSRKPRRPGQRKRGHGTMPKTPVIGAVERNEDGRPVRVRARVTADTKGATVLPFIEETVAPGSRVYTDEYGVYRPLAKRGYRHDFVRHKIKEYAYTVHDDKDGARVVHTNSIEGFWSQVKGGVLNVHRGVSPRYLQRYVDEFAFRYSHRQGGNLFGAMLSRAVSVQPDLRRPETPRR